MEVLVHPDAFKALGILGRGGKQVAPEQDPYLPAQGSLFLPPQAARGRRHTGGTLGTGWWHICHWGGRAPCRLQYPGGAGGGSTDGHTFPG